MTISGVTSGKSMMKLDAPEPASVPAGEAERQEHADRDGDEDVRAGELEALHERVTEGRVVPDGVDRVAPVPAGRERVPDRPRARRVEGELHRDEHRHDRPEDVGPGDEDAGSAGFPHGLRSQPRIRATGRRPGSRPRLGDRGHSAPTAPDLALRPVDAPQVVEPSGASGRPRARSSAPPRSWAAGRRGSRGRSGCRSSTSWATRDDVRRVVVAEHRQRDEDGAAEDALSSTAAASRAERRPAGSRRGHAPPRGGYGRCGRARRRAAGSRTGCSRRRARRSPSTRCPPSQSRGWLRTCVNMRKRLT